MNRQRSAQVSRKTRETDIEVALVVEGTGLADLVTGIPFLDHMLDQVARHGMLDLRVRCDGDLQIDAHHSVEDIGICIGQALSSALGDKRGIQRYGHAYVPLDEALSRVVLDFSGRPGLFYNVTFPRARVGEFDLDLVAEFFQGLVNHAQMTLHLDALRGHNAHHMAETLFKAFGRALRMGVAMDPAMADVVPSTKGSLRG
ncbi:MAG: imidazoleglycerol-phosphate dehydratase HisB [Halioglobus sp.]|nr:imidazoleglycerol-phosphate dehydratase HisB [Halioglobus sp.]